MAITPQELSQTLANNPALRIARENRPQSPTKYYVVPSRLQSMVHREGCPILRRATHAKLSSRNPILEDKFNHYQPHSCLSQEEGTPAIAAPLRSQKPKQPKSPPKPEIRSQQPAGLKEPIIFVVPGCPIPKPRQSQRDKWAKRPCVLRYRDWADKARKALESVCNVPRLETAGVVFVSAYLPMPASWSAKKKAKMRGLPHRQKPDADNLLKAAIDSCIRKDETVYRKQIYKEWAIEGQERTEIYIH